MLRRNYGNLPQFIFKFGNQLRISGILWVLCCIIWIGLLALPSRDMFQTKFYPNWVYQKNRYLRYILLRHLKVLSKSRQIHVNNNRIWWLPSCKPCSKWRLYDNFTSILLNKWVIYYEDVPVIISSNFLGLMMRISNLCYTQRPYFVNF